MILTRDQILAASRDYPYEDVEIPELKGTVRIRVLNLEEVEAVKKNTKPNEEPLNLYPRLIAQAVIDENGNPLFTGEDIKLIRTVLWPAADRMAREILRINKMIANPEDNGGPKA